MVSLFVLGWTLSDVFDQLDSEQPVTVSSITGKVVETVNLNSERPSPHDIVPEKDIHVFSNKVVINLDDPEWAKFTDTNSMDPVIDEGANAIQIVPDKPEQVQVGDIISFSTKYEPGVIIHRVIETGNDEQGWYAVTKGDNNAYRDPGKRRFSDVKKLLVAIVY